MQTLATISQRAGVAIPSSDVPSLKPIGNLTVLGGSPLHIPLDGYDPTGGPLTYTITSDNPALVAPTLIEGNRSMEIAVSGWGSMVFQLFEDRASRPTSRVVELAEADFYNGIIFHRVIADFVIQGGDPTGTGTGGSDLGDFDDQFHVDLQHNRSGLLSYAKSTDDTNDSQFFVTLGPTRHLDFNHSIFGILVEGYSVLNAIGNTATTTGDRPVYDIVMNSVNIFDDLENGVVMLKAAEGANGQANVTVKVTNSLGKSVQETFQVTVKPDTTANGGANGGPFLLDIAPLTTSMNTPVNLQLQAVDVEGDPVYFDASAVTTPPYTFTVNHDTGLVTVTPNTGFVGTTEVIVAVRAAAGSNTSDTWDRQAVPLTVLPGTPVLDLLAASDSNIATDNVTNVTNLQFRVSNVSTGGDRADLARRDGDRTRHGQRQHDRHYHEQPGRIGRWRLFADRGTGRRRRSQPDLDAHCRDVGHNAAARLYVHAADHRRDRTVSDLQRAESGGGDAWVYVLVGRGSRGSDDRCSHRGSVLDADGGSSRQ